LRYPPPIEERVDHTEGGIRVGNTLDYTGLGPTESVDEDSNFDENQEIIDLEMRDFDNEDGIQAEL
jgi:hypothetical protein